MVWTPFLVNSYTQTSDILNNGRATDANYSSDLNENALRSLLLQMSQDSDAVLVNSERLIGVVMTIQVP